MKKLFTLFLVLAGMVGSVSAAKLYVNTSTNASWWTNVRIYAYNSDSDNNGWNYNESGVVSSTTTLFGKEWYVFDMGNYENAIVQYFESSNHSISNQSSEITNITNDRFVFIPGTQTDGKWIWYENGYTFRSNVLNNWSATACNMEVVDANTLSYTLTKETIKSSSVNKIWFRILNQDGQIYPDEKKMNPTLSLATAISSNYYNNWSETSWSFGIDIPTYDYEKIVVTASLSGTTWTIKADAYISKTITSEGIATFGSEASVDFSKAVPALTAKKGKVGYDGKITWKPATTLYGGEGALIEGASGKYSIPVTVDATADTENNDFVAITKTKKINQTESSKYAYILAKVDGALGFYKPAADKGSWCAAGTAYLSTEVTPAGARGFFPLWDDTNSIDLVKQQITNGEVYSLSGQRVKSPLKGLYIVNGKKVIIK